MYENLLALITLFSLIPQTVIAEDTEILAELDAVWAEVSRTVVEGDFDGMAAVYHEDAVLVNSISGSSYPISEALERWKPGIEQTKNGEVEAQVSFRFSQRLHDKETAHETGIFNYTSKPKGGEPSGSAVHFEALLVKKNGAWKMIMEHQKSSATEEEWITLAASVDSDPKSYAIAWKKDENHEIPHAGHSKCLMHFFTKRVRRTAFRTSP